MNHNDGGEQCVCSECGSQFQFTSAEQRFYEERGLNYPPKRCKTCRMARKAAGPGAGAGGGRGAPQGRGRESGGFAGRDSGGFRGPAGYGGGAPRSDDRRGPPPQRFGQQGAPNSFGQGAPRSFDQGNTGYRPREGGFDQRPPRVGGFAPRAPRFGDDRGGFRARSNFDAPPPPAYGQNRAPAYGQDRPAPRQAHDNREAAEPRKARVAREKPKFDITCQQCSAHATVPFKPLPGRDIFCPACYRARKSLSPEERAATSIASTGARADKPVLTDDRATAPGGDVSVVTAAPTVEGSPHEE